MNEEALARGIAKGISYGISGAATKLATGAVGVLFLTSLIYPDLFKDLGTITTHAASTVVDTLTSLSSGSGEDVAKEAFKWVKPTPKQFKPGQTERCADFVRTVLEAAHVKVGVTQQPIDAGQQDSNGALMARSFFGKDIGPIINNAGELQPGDIIGIYGTYGGAKWQNAITHVGIYVGNGMVIDRPTESKPVQYRPLGTWSRWVGVRPNSYKTATASGKSGDFDKALAFTLQWEGGYSDHPADSGGKTYKGITQAEVPGKDVSKLSDAEVKQIYYDRYWKKFGCDRYPYELALVCFDSYVNFNPQTAGSFFQGVSTSNPKQAALEVVNKRLAFRVQRVQEKPSQSAFLVGWQRRDNALAAEVKK